MELAATLLTDTGVKGTVQPLGEACLAALFLAPQWEEQTLGWELCLN